MKNENWKTVRLGDVCEIQSGGTPSRSKVEYWKGGTIPWVKIGDFTGKYLSKSSEFITEEGLNNSSTKLFTKGTVLYSIFATLGEVAILDINATTNQAIAGLKIIDNEKLNTDYFYSYLKSLKDEVCRIGRGVAQSNINLSILRDFKIPLPPLEEQKHIAAVLDKCTEVIAKHKLMLEKYDTLVKSQFVEMFGDNPVDNGKWRIESLEELCKIITDGTHQPPKFTTSGIPFLFVSNIAGNKITYETEKFISEETYTELYKRTPIEIGDLLLSTVGSYGHPAIVENEKKFLFQRHIAYLKPKTDLLNSVYFHGSLLSPDAQKQIEERVKGIAQKTLNLSEIRKIKIPVPPIALQEKFAQFVQAVDAQKAKAQKSLDKAGTLYKALMQEYFGA